MFLRRDFELISTETGLCIATFWPGDADENRRNSGTSFAAFCFALIICHVLNTSDRRAASRWSPAATKVAPETTVGEGSGEKCVPGLVPEQHFERPLAEMPAGKAPEHRVQKGASAKFTFFEEGH